MSDEVICEFCDKKFKNKNTLTIHQKNTARCIKIQVEKLGKPLHDKKVEKKSQEHRESEDESDNERSEHEDKRIISSDSEDDHIKWSDDEVKESESSDDEPLLIKRTPTKKEPVKKEIKKETIKRSPHESPRTHNHISPLVEAKIDMILTNFSKLEKDLDIKFKNVNSQINKLHSVLEDCNPVVIIETIKRLQAMIEVKQENVENIKEQFDELYENYYSVYKKIKYVKEDLEDIIHK